MGWSVGYDPNWNRDVGYGVPAKCDHPDCDADIDRGLSYVCGGDVYGDEHGCGLFFCDAHLRFAAGSDEQQRCDNCIDGSDPFTPKPDVPLWINHKLTDPSWQQWRTEYPNEVKALQAANATPKASDE